MAKATTLAGHKIVVLLGNDATPIVYTAPCAFEQKSIEWSKTVNRSDVPDCAEPGAAGWSEADAISRMLRISGGGVLATESVDTWLDAWAEDDPIPARVEIVKSSGTTDVYEGLLHVTSVTIEGNRGERAQLRIEAESHGPFEKQS